MSAKGIRINKSKIVHRYFEGSDRTSCGAGGMDSVSHTGGIPTDDAVTCKRCIKSDELDAVYAVQRAARVKAEVDAAHEEALGEGMAREAAARRRAATNEALAYQTKIAENADRIREEDHAEALAEEFERTHRPHWLADNSGAWKQDGLSLTCDLPVKRGTFGHPGPCFDRVAGVQRAALSLPRSQRKAARRQARAKLRRTSPQTRAAASARRTQRGAARATAKTLLVASGMPQDVARRYAPAFSRGVQAPTASARIRIGEHRSKRVEVKRYSWPLFVETLAAFVTSSRRQSFEVMPTFRRVRDRVLAAV